MALAAPERRAFIDALATTGNVIRACEMAGVDRRAVYRLRASDEAFAASWAEAQELGVDALEDEATRRAHEGVDEPVYYQGEVCGHVRRYSDGLLQFLLKARRPERFKDRISNEHSGSMTLQQLVESSMPPK